MKIIKNFTILQIKFHRKNPKITEKSFKYLFIIIYIIPIPPLLLKSAEIVFALIPCLLYYDIVPVLWYLLIVDLMMVI